MISIIVGFKKGTKAADETKGQALVDMSCNWALVILLTRKFCLLQNLEQGPRLIQQAELFRWLVKTDIRLAACFSVDMYRSASTEDGNTPLRETASPVVGGSDGAINGGGGAVQLSTKRPPHVVYDEGVAEASTAGLGHINGLGNSPEPPPPGRMSRKFAADILPECQLLGKIAQR